MKHFLLLTFVLVCYSSFSVCGQSSKKESKQQWGYLEVRPGAFMFYWLYFTIWPATYTEKPWVIYLSGGPGVSATGIANFRGIGPLDKDLQKRKYSWVTEANVLFIDSPVGTGFSYVKNLNLLTTNNTQIASDLAQFITKFLQTDPTFEAIPLYIFGESYGGKMAAEFVLQLHQKIKEGTIKCNLKGLTIGSAFISASDSALNMAPYLYAMSMIDSIERDELNASTYRFKAAMDMQQYQIANMLFNETISFLRNITNGGNIHNILLPDTPPLTGLDFPSELMNGHLRQIFRIIPNNVVWISTNLTVYAALAGDYMKPGVNAVEKLLTNTNLTINVYNGQLDVIVNILGTLQWVEKLNWSGIPDWKKAPRIPITINNETAMFVKSYEHFGFYWVLKAGHLVPNDQQQTSLRLLQLITNPKN